MEIGIFAKTFAGDTVEGVLDAVAATGVRQVQFNLSIAGLPTLPEYLDPSVAATIRVAFSSRGLEMAAISGTFNMAHPDAAVRAAGLERLRVLAEHCGSLGTRIITLCSGTRDPDNMWRRHEENDSSPAWRDMAASMAEAARIGEATGVTMAFEPEVANVIDTALKARRLLDEVGSQHLKVVLDAANLFRAGELARQGEILDQACTLLAGDIVLAHAKDITHDGEAGHDAAGTGLLDYDRYLRNLQGARYDGPLILHGLSEAQVPQSVAFLQEMLARTGSQG
jgi:sugar phosphate isomerase/epimerase